MTGTTFAVSWCVSLRRCADAGHDLRKTLIAAIKNRTKETVVIGLDEPCAPKRFIRRDALDARRHNLVHGLPARTALVLFLP
ncbi:hypothetical protein [Pseudomonas putida]|jgi:hypothetical protein|uniref:hypothetical protein n=1 Tax=Pseudomonas putida TaxID=303 RepID=UPI003D97BA9D